MNIQLGIIIALGVGLLFFGWQNYSLRNDNEQLLKNEGTYKTQIVELTSNNQVKDKQIELCSQKTRELEALGKAREGAAEKARIEATKKSRENKKLADELLATKRNPKITACQQAEYIGKNYVKKRKAKETSARPN